MMPPIIITINLPALYLQDVPGNGVMELLAC